MKQKSVLNPKARWQAIVEYKLCAHHNKQLKDCITLGTVVYIDDPDDTLRFVEVGPMALQEFVKSFKEASSASVVQIAKMTPGDIPGFWQSNLVRN